MTTPCMHDPKRQRWQPIGVLSAARVAKLRQHPSVNCVTLDTGVACLVLLIDEEDVEEPQEPEEDEGFGDDRGMMVVRNRCKHQGGKFVQDIEDVGAEGGSAVVVKCTNHGWKFDMKTRRCVGP